MTKYIINRLRLAFFILLFCSFEGKLVQAYPSADRSFIRSIGERVYLVNQNDKSLIVYDTFLNHIQTVSFAPAQLYGFFPSPDGSKVAIALRDESTAAHRQHIALLSLPNLTPLSEISNIESTEILWKSDSRYLVAETIRADSSSSLVVIDTVTTLIEKRIDFNVSVEMFSIHPTNNLILMRSDDGITVQDVFGTLGVIKQLPKVLRASYSPNGDFAAIAYDPSTISIVETVNYTSLRTITTPTLDISGLDWTARGVFVVSLDWKSYLFDPATGQEIWSISNGIVDHFAWKEDGSYFYRLDLNQGTTAHSGDTGAVVVRPLLDIIATYTPDPNYPVPTANYSTYFAPARTSIPGLVPTSTPILK